MRLVNVIRLLAIGAVFAHPVSLVWTAQDELCAAPFLPVSTPLTDLGDSEYVRMDGQATGFRGGLYPDGRNSRPPAHEAAGQAIAATIVPLNEAGAADANGRIAIISVGMSNTASEFQGFMDLLHGHPEVNERVTAVNGAQGGRTAERWTAVDSDVWLNLDEALNRAQVTPAQVQVVWMKQTLTRGGDFPEKAQELQAHLGDIVRALKVRFPNLKIVYLSSRTRSYTYARGLSPEPVAFETAFAVKWLIAQQINGDAALNYDSARGEVVAPYLSWGPYLWVDGENARSDGRTWLAADMTQDCTHPSGSGNQKVAEMLLAFFLTDSTTGWFRAAETPVMTSPTATVSPTQTAVLPTPTSTPSAPPSPTDRPRPTDSPAPATAVAATAPAAAADTLPTATVVALPGNTGQDTAVWPVAAPVVAVVGTAVIIGGWFAYRQARSRRT